MNRKHSRLWTEAFSFLEMAPAGMPQAGGERQDSYASDLRETTTSCRNENEPPK